MRIGIAKIMQETSTFSTQPTDLESILAYGVVRGQEVVEKETMWDWFVTGFLDVVGTEEPVGITKATAMPAGNLTAEAQEAVMGWFEEDLQKALPLDGLLLSLHGAFAGDLDPDIDGLVVERARQIVGPEMPIGVSLDLHANLTARMVEHADIIDVMHTHPHVDMQTIGQRVARTLVATIKGEVHPVISAVKIPLITPAETQISDEPPLKDLMDMTRKQEEDPRVLHSAVCAVQPWMDIPEMGWCSVVTTDGDRGLADELARELAVEAWDKRREYTRPCPTHVEALDEAFASDLRPVVISDLADLMTGGGTGDSTWYLKEFLARQPEDPCYLTMVDPGAAAEMAAAGEGVDVTLELGGKQDNIHSTPVEVTGRVQKVISVSADRELPEGIGLTVVLKVDNIYIVVFERLGSGSDPVLYSGAGLDPKAAKILISKSVVDFREGFKEVAELFLLGEAPGLAPANLLKLEWKRVPRPIYPFDEETTWSSDEGTMYRNRPENS
jgi:microcystin degradation protein MlrC